MTNTYTIPAVAKNELQKKLERLAKKASAYGNHLAWSFGEEFVATRNVYRTDYETRTQVWVGEQKVFAVEVTIDSDIVRKEGYTVVGQIECLEYGKNIVKMFDETPVYNGWYTEPLVCMHCCTTRARRFVFIVKDERGVCTTVGKTCLKDYCGIDPKLIAMSQQLTDEIVKAYDIDEYDFTGSGDFGYEVLKVIATANDIIKENGYIKADETNNTKQMLCVLFGQSEPSENSMKLAQKMREELSQADYNELTDFLKNVKSLIDAKYCRMSAFGYLAYAPVAFQNYMKKKEQKQDQEEAKGLSDYIGNVGDKITVEVKEARLVTSWQTVYGFTHLYKFTTTDNNVLVWYASKCIDENAKKINGTIKDHKEYNGEKQTVLTRCKVA